MAVSRTVGEFVNRVDILIKDIAGGVDRTVRTAALVGDQVLVSGTPVDSGRARAGWIGSVGNPDTSTLPEIDPKNPDPGGAAGIALASGQEAVAAWPGPGQGAGIFFSNNVEYVGELDNGSSGQAPAGMTAAAHAAVADVLHAGKLI